MVRFVEPGNSGCKRLQLGFTSWDISRSLDSIHEALFIVLDSWPPELALRDASVGVSHVDFAISRHQVLQVIHVLLLFLGLFPGPTLRHLCRDIQIRSLFLSFPMLTTLIFAIRLFRNGLVVFILIEALVRNVVIRWRVLHGAIH